MIALVGQKVGMTRVFTEEGQSIPVTVIEIEPNRVTQIKTEAKEGYTALQLASGEQKAQRVNKPELGHYAKAGVPPAKYLKEAKISSEVAAQFALGDVITLDAFKSVGSVDVIGLSKGKGFAGVVKRWNFRTQDMSHGNSLSHRAPGSIGQNQTPGRVFKGKKMCGHLGDERITMQNLKVIRVDETNNVLLVKGAIPGPSGGMVIVQPSLKH